MFWRAVLWISKNSSVVDDQASRPRACRRACSGCPGRSRVELRVHPLGVVGRRDARRLLEVVLRQEREQVAAVLEARVLVLGGEVRDAGLRVVGHRAAELLEVDLLAGDRLDHVGAGDEHVGGLLDHEDEVGDRGRVDGAAGARAHDQADLRDDARALDVAHEDVAVGAERDDALLDARAARVVDADHGAADLRRQVHDLAHLLAHHLAERAAEDGEVLAEDADRRPSIVPWPVTTASPQGRFFSRPNSSVRWRTNVSSSWKEPGSSSFSIRSRAVYLPFACCFSSASGEECAPPAQLLQVGELVVEVSGLCGAVRWPAAERREGRRSGDLRALAWRDTRAQRLRLGEGGGGRAEPSRPP